MAQLSPMAHCFPRGWSALTEELKMRGLNRTARPPLGIPLAGWPLLITAPLGKRNSSLRVHVMQPFLFTATNFRIILITHPGCALQTRALTLQGESISERRKNAGV